MKFVFHTTKFTPIPGQPGWSSVETFAVYAPNLLKAVVFLFQNHVLGGRVWAWYEVPEESCTCCGGPFHPASGHWESDVRHWCGPCTRDFVTFLKGHTSRRWGKQYFYDFAVVPTGDTSEQDLAGDRRG